MSFTSIESKRGSMKNKKVNKSKRGIGTLFVITVCLVSVMSPAMTQSSIPQFSNASNVTTPEPTPVSSSLPTPTPTPTPTPFPTHTPTPIQSLASNFTPSTPFFIYGWVLYENGDECYDPAVNIISLSTNESGHAESSVDSNYFQLLITNISEGDILAFNASDGTQFNTTNYTITPADINTSGIFGINLTLEIVNASLDFAVTNISFTINDEPVEPMNLTTGERIFINATVNITNLANCGGSVEVGCYLDNTSLLNTTTVSFDANNVISYATFNWTANVVKDHSITVIADPNNETVELNESNNIFSQPIYVNAPDLTVTNLTTKKPVVCDYPNNVTATIMNEGKVSANTSVEFYAAKNLSIIRWFGGHDVLKTDIITQLGAKKIRVDFSYISINPWSDITIYDKYDNLVDIINSSNYQEYNWTKWVKGDIIKIYSHSMAEENITSIIDKYEYAFANTTISLTAYTSTNISRIWNATPATITNETDSSYVMLKKYTISAIVDPEDSVRELNETNNKNRGEVYVKPPWDFTLTNIKFIPEKPREGEVVSINASIENLGISSINTTSAFYVDDNLLAIKDVYADIDKTNYVEANWTAGPSFFFRTEKHDITVIVDSDDKIPEWDEDNNDGNTTITIIQSANLTITNLTFDPDDLVAGSPVNVTATIMNEGNASENCTNWFYLGKNETYYSSSFSSNITISSIGACAIQVHIKEATKRAGYSDSECILDVTGCEDSVNYSYNGRLEDIWTEWCRGDNVTISWKHYNGITIDKYRIPLGSKTASLKTGDSVNCTIVWKNATQGNHILWVEVNDNITGRDVFVSGTDLAVMNVSVIKNHSVVSEVWDGDLVNITANITNKGRKNAANFTVNFTDNGKVFNVTNVSGLAAGDSIDSPPVIWNASIKSENEVAYNHTIRAEIDPNNWNDTMVHVKRSRDFAVTNINFTVNSTLVNTSELMLGELVTLNATVNITNLANSGGNVEVGFYLDDKEGRNHLINNTFINRTFPGGNGTVYASLDWHVVNLDDDVSVLGNHNITVIVDPENQTIELNEANNASCHEIYVKAPDLAVTNITVESESPEEGKLVNITATVVNNGDKNESNATVTFVDRWKGIESRIDVITTSLNISNRKNISVNWTAFPAGLHNITVSIEAENVPGHELTNVTVVRGADLTVSNLSLTVNGTEITVKDTIKHGDVLNITANITNIGIRPANGFNVSFFVDGVLLNITFNASSINLSENESINNVSATWAVTVGSHTIEVIADHEDRIAETDEANNAMLKSMCVQGADLLVTDITFTAIPPENAINISTTNTNSNAIFDTDTVMINATIANQGILPADENFTIHIFYEYASLGSFSRASDSMGACGKKLPDECWQWENRSYDGAECILLHIDDNAVNINNNLRIYDTKGNIVASSAKLGWIPVLSDTVKLNYNDVHGVGLNIHFYAGNITENTSTFLDVDEWGNVSLKQSVSGGNHPVRVFVDPENNVTEHDEGNNIANRTMHVLPSRDFTADLRLFRNNGTRIGANDTVWDGDTVLINAAVCMGINESDIYHEYREGTAEVEIIDEHEWVDILPRCELTPYGYGEVITYPGADAIRVHFKELSLPSNGFVVIKDKEGHACWSRHNLKEADISSDWIHGDTIYVCKEKGLYDEPVGGRITFVIDKYQYRKTNHTAVSLNASEIENIIAEWNVSAWNHTMRVIADPEDKVGEINESNNEMNETLPVEANKDPAVMDITFDPEEPAMGSDVTINALIANKGNKTANFSVDLWAVKTEHHPFASPHDDVFPCWTADGWNSSNIWEINSTYAEADWMGVHFTRINTTTPPDTKWRSLYVDDGNNNRMEYFTNFKSADIWLWANASKIKLETPPGSSPVWGFSIDNHGYKLILNRTTLTLAPNETVPVTGILSNVRAGNRSLSYDVYATVDMDNVVYEMNEMNNELVKTLNIGVADFTVDINPPDGEYENGYAVFRNVGFHSENNVRIRFSQDVYCSEEWWSEKKTFSCPRDPVRIPPYSIQDDVEWTRIHFEKLNIREEGWLEVGNERYEKSKSGFWSPWVEENGVMIDYCDAKFKIDRYEFANEEFINKLEAGGYDEKKREIPWGYKEPYYLTAWVDPEINRTDDITGDVREGNEDNNTKAVLVYIDLVPEIEFASPDIDKLSMDVDEFEIEAAIRNDDTLEDGLAFPVSGFDVTLEVKRPDGTAPLFTKTQHVEEKLYGGQNKIVTFKEQSIFPAAGNYTVSVKVSANGITELDEDNNIVSENVTVYPYSGYAAGEPLTNVARGTVSPGGRVVYIVEPVSSTTKIPPGENYTVNFNLSEVIPDDVNIGDTQLARLYYYWWTWHKVNGTFVPSPANVFMDFNPSLGGENLSKAGDYSDISFATDVNFTVGLYSYDVSLYIKKGDNVAVLRNSRDVDWDAGVEGVGLLIIYRDEDEPLTKYWIDEGADVIQAKNNGTDTGLPFHKCIVQAPFEDVEPEDVEKGNASLLTVLGARGIKPLYDDAEGEGDVLWFNRNPISPLTAVEERDEEGKTVEGTSHWRRIGAWMAQTENEWEDVTDYLDEGDNLAEFQSKGNYMVVTNAILKIRCQPDLVPSLEKAPSRVAIGNSYEIPVVIRNEGKSKARDFNVSFYVDGELKINKSVDAVVGEGSTELNFAWRAPFAPKIVELKVVVDPENEIKELINSRHGDGESNNVDTKTVTVGLGEITLRPPGGGGRKELESSRADAVREGAEGEAAGAIEGGGEAVAGEKGGQAITGYLMKGRAVSSEEGGGRKEEFSMLALLLRLGMLAAAVSLVCAGYWLERRRQRKDINSEK